MNNLDTRFTEFVKETRNSFAALGRKLDVLNRSREREAIDEELSLRVSELESKASQSLTRYHLPVHHHSPTDQASEPLR